MSEGSDWTAQMARILVDTKFVSVELIKVQKYPRTREVLKIFESAS